MSIRRFRPGKGGRSPSEDTTILVPKLYPWTWVTSAGNHRSWAGNRWIQWVGKGQEQRRSRFPDAAPKSPSPTQTAHVYRYRPGDGATIPDDTPSDRKHALDFRACVRNAWTRSTVPSRCGSTF